jgi:hypothetical protein
MATYLLDDIIQIIINNPNREKLEAAKERSKLLKTHLLGIDLESAIKNCDYFAPEDLFKVQKQYATSNVDLFERILGQEDMVFNTKGGSVRFGLAEANEKALNAVIETLRGGMHLRKWIQTFALQAYRCDPMGIIFMEVETASVIPNKMTTPDCYPTYKSVEDIYDYDNNGRTLEFICFKLNVDQCREFGIIDESLKDAAGSTSTEYFRFIDDEKDVILKRENNTASVLSRDAITQKNPLKNNFGKVPGFIISDIVDFNDVNCFHSPIDKLVELADTFLQDRSIRNLQKKYHGFAKPVEPIVDCPACKGLKTVNGKPCKACAVNGESTGIKLKTKVSDVLRIPMTVFSEGSGFSFDKIYGYATPDIKSWDKQDTSLYELFLQIYQTYWGTRPNQHAVSNNTNSNDPQKTAYEISSDLQPIHSRLNKTADWAEKTESFIINFLGKYWFRNEFKQATVVYSRDYILRTPEELMDTYQLLLSKGAPDFAKDEALEKYYQAKYNTNTNQMQKYLKMLKIEPFPHDTVANIEKSSVIPFEDKLAKRYFGEWSDTILDIQWITAKPKDLKEKLKEYIAAKGIVEPAPAKPGVPVNA